MKRKKQIKVDFGLYIKQLRLKQNLTICALAARSGLDCSQVQLIEAGEVDAFVTDIYGLAEGLDLPVAVLLSELE
jgi:transcriptional regulator with XRE-family HTH domain